MTFFQVDRYVENAKICYSKDFDFRFIMIVKVETEYWLQQHQLPFI